MSQARPVYRRRRPTVEIYEQHKQVETADGRADTQLIADTTRDARQTENITKEIPASQVFDFSYLPAR